MNPFNFDMIVLLASLYSNSPSTSKKNILFIITHIICPSSNLEIVTFDKLFISFIFSLLSNSIISFSILLKDESYIVIPSLWIINIFPFSNVIDFGLDNEFIVVFCRIENNNKRVAGM